MEVPCRASCRIHKKQRKEIRLSIYRNGNSPYWWIDLAHPHGHGRIRKSTGETTKAKAQRKHDEIKAALWKAKVSGRQLSDAFAAWTELKPRSRNDENAVKQVLREYGDCSLSDFSTTRFFDIFSNKNPGTYNRLLATTRAAIGVANKRGWISELPKFEKRREPEKRIRWITHEEANSLLYHLAPHLRQMAAFTLETGIRWSNCSFLRWENVHINRKLAIIEPEDAKGEKAISIPLSNTACRILLDQKGLHDTYVFTYRGMAIQSPKTGFNLACEKARIRDFRWHDLRHTWASWHVQNGTPISVLKELGGWADIKMVLRYAHLAPEHIAQYAGNTKQQKSKVVQMKRKKA